MEYILFVGEDANFAPKAMKIPLEAFKRDQPELYEKLIVNSIKGMVLLDVQIDNLLYLDYKDCQSTEESSFLARLIHYADGVDCDGFWCSNDTCDNNPKRRCFKGDMAWYNDVKILHANDFNPIISYKKQLGKHSYKMSFLCLERHIF